MSTQSLLHPSMETLWNFSKMVHMEQTDFYIQLSRFHQYKHNIMIPVLLVIEDWENYYAEDNRFQTMAGRLRISLLSKVGEHGLCILSSLDNHIVPIQKERFMYGCFKK